MEDIVIVGAGIAGLATSLGLHRLGIKSIVLESADSLRTTGFALGLWPNAWRALDAISIAEVLRRKHNRLQGAVTISVDSGVSTSELSFGAADLQSDHDVRYVKRQVLLETLRDELPTKTIRYSSKVDHIESDGCFKSIHLSDGTVLKTKVLIGCDGVNSVVAKFLGFSKPSVVGRLAVRGSIDFEDGHGLEPKHVRFFGKDVKFGVIPVDDHSVYWFFTFSPSPQDKEMVEHPARLKQFILGSLGKVSDKYKQVFEKTELENMVFAPLSFRLPWELLWGNISKDNVCVIGDALHPMIPDLGQGGCSALEDSVVLARILGKALKDTDEENEEWRIKRAMEKFAQERRWRSFDLVATSYLMGCMQQSDGFVMHLLRDKLLANFLPGVLLKKASFDCGHLN